ncbi:biotin transporter BioY [Candidatus Formimonas warabiya]|uniref:Biotin transporter n=1 Tax=Formimonas warabiya TaxID=1761012 RepID=A0A3G1L2C5_FORW1|nr:biotin transporter BioY [Candidatus Formimonas warabiya]ATW28811.1 hypothetical protein DCMF_21925 [Candidatus Formimonas warabiya]
MKDMTAIAMFAALTAVLSQIAVPLPFSPVPVTLQTFAVVFTGIVLGSRKGTGALIVYTLMGLFGLPVFSQAKSGLSVLVGPTGGYLFGFIIAAFLIGKIVERSAQVTYFRALVALVIGVTVIYAAGVIQLKFVMNVTFPEAFAMGAAPYLPLEVVKVLVGAYLGCAVRRAVLKALPEFGA